MGYFEGYNDRGELVRLTPRELFATILIVLAFAVAAVMFGIALGMLS